MNTVSRKAAPAGIALLHEACDFMRDEIDTVFGEGTSEKAFGEYRSLDMIEQFFTGITPYIQKARQKKTQKYTNPVIEKRRQIEGEKAEKSQVTRAPMGNILIDRLPESVEINGREYSP